MQKLFLSIALVFGFTMLNAQTDSLEQYTGKYVFPEGSPVKEIGVVVENGVLTATSAIGNSELRKTDTKDVFEVVAYSGTATFKRNEEGKITGMVIQAQDVNMEGTKSEGLQIGRELINTTRIRL
jgi:hypothetical protein